MIILFIGEVQSGLGFDISTRSTEKFFTCAKNSNYTKAIIRCYKEHGLIDTNCTDSITKARKANFTDVDVYFFPCPKCKDSGMVQFGKMVNHIMNSNLTFGMAWIDVEIVDRNPDYWYKNTTLNGFYLASVFAGCVLNGITCGIYSNSRFWKTLINNSYPSMAGAQLWYTNPDSNPNFDNFKPFGGWDYPVMKQYQFNTPICGMNTDLDFFPDQLPSIHIQ
eukprot:gene3132-3914_t